MFLGAVDDKVLLSRQARDIARSNGKRLPDSVRLQSISQQYGVNTATLVLEQCLRSDANHGRFIRLVERSSSSTTTIGEAPLLVIVPGLYYKERPELGGDAALIQKIARQFGIATEVVPTKSLGGIEENTEILHRYLQTMNTPYWLASISRGGAEIKWLLYRYADAAYLENLQMWISVNGIVRGSRLLDRVGDSTLTRWLFRSMARLNRIDPRLVDELHHTRVEWAATQLPKNTQYYNIISLPMSWDITAPVQSRYRQLSCHGPNDGAVVLGDYLSEPGLCFPVAGVDHLMRNSNLSDIFYKLINHLMVNTPRPSEEAL